MKPIFGIQISRGVIQRTVTQGTVLLGVGGFFIILIIFFSFRAENFFTGRNGINVLENVAVLGVVAGLASIGAGPLAFALTPANPAVRQVTIAMVQPGVISNATLRTDAGSGGASSTTVMYFMVRRWTSLSTVCVG